MHLRLVLNSLIINMLNSMERYCCRPRQKQTTISLWLILPFELRSHSSSEN